MTTPTRSRFRNIRIVASTGNPVTARRVHAAPTRETLMPYEAVAKAIFVRANGAAAYYKATGIVPPANDSGVSVPGGPQGLFGAH